MNCGRQKIPAVTPENSPLIWKAIYLRSTTSPSTAAERTFQQRVWQGLRRIPAGETWQYGELAKKLGRPDAPRAVGAANGRNPLSIVVPCHRLIGSTGKLTGYGGGLRAQGMAAQARRRPHLNPAYLNPGLA